VEPVVDVSERESASESESASEGESAAGTEVAIPEVEIQLEADRDAGAAP
jgi:hypothetical protein